MTHDAMGALPAATAFPHPGFPYDQKIDGFFNSHAFSGERAGEVLAAIAARRARLRAPWVDVLFSMCWRDTEGTRFSYASQGARDDGRVVERRLRIPGPIRDYLQSECESGAALLIAPALHGIFARDWTQMLALRIAPDGGACGRFEPSHPGLRRMMVEIGGALPQDGAVALSGRAETAHQRLAQAAADHALGGQLIRLTKEHGPLTLLRRGHIALLFGDGEDPEIPDLVAATDVRGVGAASPPLRTRQRQTVSSAPRRGDAGPQPASPP